MPQVLEFSASTGQTITAKRFALGSDTVVDSVTAVEKTNDKNRYVATFSTTRTGAYRINGFVGAVGGFANEWYDLTDEDKVFLPRSEAASAGGGSSLSGPNAITVTVTDADTDDAIEGATVRFYRTGETGTLPTDVDGEAVFGLATATWSWIATASGYSGRTGILSVSENGTLAIEMTAISVTIPSDPALATLTVKCLDEAGAIEPGAKVYVRIVGIPSGSTGLTFDGISQDATANGSGIASLTIVKLAKYEIRRGDSKQWKKFTAGSADAQTVVSFIGVDPVVS